MSKSDSKQPDDDTNEPQFVADPHLRTILSLPPILNTSNRIVINSSRDNLSTSDDNPQQQQHQQQQTTVKPKATTFGLVLVSGWPHEIATALQESYMDFIGKIKQCFDPIDIHTPPYSTPNDITSPTFPPSSPSVYIYPIQHLHVTIATLRPFTLPTPSSHEKQHKITRLWRNMIHSASQRKEWPFRRHHHRHHQSTSSSSSIRITTTSSSPMVLKFVGAQIGQKAGILLWKEITGQLQAMRTCLREEYELLKKKTKKKDEDNDHEIEEHDDSLSFSLLSDEESSFHIPNIVHSTFMRYSSKPTTPWNIVQERFDRLFSLRPPNHDASLTQPPSSCDPLDHYFQTIEISTVALVMERTPYMHIPYDEDHVLDCFS